MAETSYQMLVVLSFLRSEDCITYFTKGEIANFSSEKWQNEALRGLDILRIREKILSEISYSARSRSRPRI